MTAFHLFLSLPIDFCHACVCCWYVHLLHHLLSSNCSSVPSSRCFYLFLKWFPLFCIKRAVCVWERESLWCFICLCMYRWICLCECFCTIYNSLFYLLTQGKAQKPFPFYVSVVQPINQVTQLTRALLAYYTGEKVEGVDQESQCGATDGDKVWPFLLILLLHPFCAAWSHQLWKFTVYRLLIIKFIYS